jgi:hypothetical protein
MPESAEDLGKQIADMIRARDENLRKSDLPTPEQIAEYATMVRTVYGIISDDPIAGMVLVPHIPGEKEPYYALLALSLAKKKGELGHDPELLHRLIEGYVNRSKSFAPVTEEKP